MPKKEEVVVESNSHNFETNGLVDSSFMLNFNDNAGNISLSQMKQYIKYPMIYNEVVRTISRQFYHTNGMYANVIDYLVAMPNLDTITVCRTKNKKSAKTKTKFNLLLKLLNHKRTARDILRHMFIDGMYVGILRDTVASNKNPDLNLGTINIMDRIEGLSLDDNFMIQPLDLNYCKIIGFQNNISISAFDMMYFDRYIGNGLINENKNYPVEFVKAYSDYKKDGAKRWFKLDYKKTIALKFKANENQAYGLPYGLSAFTKMFVEEEYENSQYKLIEELASSIYYMILPEGEKKGSCSLNKTQQENVISAFKDAVKVKSNTAGAKISTLTLAPGTELDRLAKDASLLKDTLSDENMKKVSTGLGFASSALNAESQSASYSNLQVNIQLIQSQLFQCLDEVSVEMTRVLNDHIGNKPADYIDVKYLRTSALNQDEMYSRAKDIYTSGSGSLKMWVACAGFDPDDYLSLMQEELDEGIYEKFKPHATSFTYSGDDEGKGAPKKADGKLSDAGRVSRDLGSNEKKVKK